MRSPLIVVATAVAATLALVGCGTTESPSSASTDSTGSTGSTASDGSSESITLTDASGAEIELDGPAKKVIGTEWNVVESLVTLGVNPVGVSDVKGYTTWNTSAPLKNTPKDIGTRGEPSMDTIASLSPDLIVATTDLSPSAVGQLRKIAPVLEVRAADGTDQIGQMKETLDLIAEATGTTTQADKAKKAFDAKVVEGRKALAAAGLDGTKIASADGYVASNQVSIRPYTDSSLLGEVNTAIGLENAWSVKGDKVYGLATTDVEGLTGLGDVQFAYIGSDSEDSDPFVDDLGRNAVWKSLPFVKKGNVHRLPDGIWMFGGPQAMESYIDALVDTLTK